MEIFSDYAYYYNMFNRDKDYKKEAQTVDSLLKKYGNGVKTVINFGCGTGKHDLELAGLGYECSGIDMSGTMIEIAKSDSLRQGTAIEFSVGDIRNYDPDKKYDAVISLFHVMSYQTNDQDILSAFQSARRALGKGGIFLFDVWYGPGVLSDRPAVRVKEVEDEENLLIRVAKPVMRPDTNVCEVHYTILVINKENSITKVIREVHNMRYFFTPEIRMFLREAGFSLVENVDCISLKSTDYNSWTSYFIARAD